MGPGKLVQHKHMTIPAGNPLAGPNPSAEQRPPGRLPGPPTLPGGNRKTSRQRQPWELEELSSGNNATGGEQGHGGSLTAALTMLRMRWIRAGNGTDPPRPSRGLPCFSLCLSISLPNGIGAWFSSLFPLFEASPPAWLGQPSAGAGDVRMLLSPAASQGLSRAGKRQKHSLELITTSRWHSWTLGGSCHIHPSRRFLESSARGLILMRFSGKGWCQTLLLLAWSCDGCAGASPSRFPKTPSSWTPKLLFPGKRAGDIQVE